MPTPPEEKSGSRRRRRRRGGAAYKPLTDILLQEDMDNPLKSKFAAISL